MSFCIIGEISQFPFVTDLHCAIRPVTSDGQQGAQKIGKEVAGIGQEEMLEHGWFCKQ